MPKSPPSNQESHNGYESFGERALALCLQMHESTVAMLDRNFQIMASIRPRAKVTPFRIPPIAGERTAKKHHFIVWG
jgi:hypothetical protein